MTSIEQIAWALGGHRPRLIFDPTKRHGAVAMILNEKDAGLRVLFVERAERNGDPWSGHLAFPGGRVEPEDAGPRAAAERETMEEIGLDLGQGRYLGRLDDLTGATLPVMVSGFVYVVDEVETFSLSPEIREVFWTPLVNLVDAARHVEHRFIYLDAERAHPAIDLLGPGRPVLWGLTYRFVANLLELLGVDLPPQPWR